MTKPPLYQLTIKAERKTNESIALLLENAWPAPLSVSHYEHQDNEWHTTAHYDEQPDIPNISCLISETLNIPKEEISLEVNTIKDIDWVSHVQKGLKPVTAGRFFIHGSHDKNHSKNEAYSIEIDAAQAFGTAHHGTTKGCLEAIDSLCDELTPNTILDLGTGTGVLAIAAALCWPQANIIASDIDPVAVEIAAQNAKLNGVEKNLTHLCANGLENNTIKSNAPYDLIIANILAKPLIAMAKSITSNLKPRGTLILSGLLENQKRDVITAYQNTGLSPQRHSLNDEWAICLFLKPI